MAFLSIAVPSDIGTLLNKIPVPEKKEPQDEYHITVVYFGDDQPVEQVMKAAVVAFAVAQHTEPFVVTKKLVTCFPGNPSGTPVIAKIESPALIAFQAKLLAAFDEHGVTYSKKYPTYKPHITLAYAANSVPDVDIPELAYTVGEIVLSAGNADQDHLSMKIPLNMGFEVQNALKVAARHQSRMTHLYAR